jgi:hypothetical protein
MEPADYSPPAGGGNEQPSLELTFLPGTVGTYSNHGFEEVAGEEPALQKINQDRGSIEVRS